MNKDLSVEEYKSLRKELQQLAASISRWQMVGFISAGVFLILFILFAGKAILFLGMPYSVMLVIAGCILGIVHDLQSILRIAAYIQAFHEGEQTGALWETRLEKARAAKIFAPLRGWMTPIPSLWWAGMVCAVAPIVFAAWCIPSFSQTLLFTKSFAYILIAPAIWLIFWLAISRSYRGFGRFKNDTLAAFEQIAAGERGKVEQE